MKRRGFTLIELMVVIAIIIILAAIAIPNYLTMTERAKRSRVASDMATVATVLETYKTDWGKYPTTEADTFEDLSASTGTGLVYKALGGVAGDGALENVPSATNAVGEKGGIEYIKAGALTSMTNPFGSGWVGMQYGSKTGANWKLMMVSKGGGSGGTPSEWITRTDNTSTVATVSGSTPSVP
jgi:prepilin-type N-terminal cleavage/methylation domain-containing protein